MAEVSTLISVISSPGGAKKQVSRPTHSLSVQVSVSVLAPIGPHQGPTRAPPTSLSLSRAAGSAAQEAAVSAGARSCSHLALDERFSSGRPRRGQGCRRNRGHLGTASVEACSVLFHSGNISRGDFPKPHASGRGIPVTSCP